MTMALTKRMHRLTVYAASNTKGKEPMRAEFEYAHVYLKIASLEILIRMGRKQFCAVTRQKVREKKNETHQNILQDLVSHCAVCLYLLASLSSNVISVNCLLHYVTLTSSFLCVCVHIKYLNGMKRVPLIRVHSDAKCAAV